MSEIDTGYLRYDPRTKDFYREFEGVTPVRPRRTSQEKSKEKTPPAKNPPTKNSS